MNNKHRFYIAAFSTFLLGAGVICSTAAYTAHPPDDKSTSAKIPAYHTGPPTGTLPKTQDPDQFKDSIAKVCYRRAAKIKDALYQMPCYCHCDRHFGHKSLLDCFVSKHGSTCDVCQKELLYVDGQLKSGFSIDQIRQGINNQKWTAIDLDDHSSK